MKNKLYIIIDEFERQVETTNNLKRAWETIDENPGSALVVNLSAITQGKNQEGEKIMNMLSVTANRLVSCEMRLKEKEVEAEKLKYQLRLSRRILRHVFHEYQDLQKLKAVNVVAGEKNRGREKIDE